MIVIADTSPINYLIRIGEIEVLPKLYGRILVPASVCDELKASRAPEAVRLWVGQPPAWVEVCATTRTPDLALLKADLEIGERDAILLAQELGADELIIDDMRGRQEASEDICISSVRSLRAAGTRGLLDFKTAVDRLGET